ncbi:YdcF family protein [Thioclava electrotropha]|uniref:YdcF family protein n=1 Tax=Thioclava electrotropha TaxID=1549850 RepID=A0ABX6YX19_9RHOB|nr:YdcF family protein [Thioclava electrotropha]QPZ92042.1 YdcF family protein [Thioclava electrotropha]
MRAILILGAAVWADGLPSPSLQRRTRHAAALWQAGAAERVICCGGVGRHPPSEAEVMARILREEGVEAEAIFLEDRSTSTYENIGFARAHLESDEVIVVTDPYHAPRAVMIARRMRLRARADCPPHRASAKARVREGFAYLKLGWWFARGGPLP